MMTKRWSFGLLSSMMVCAISHAADTIQPANAADLRDCPAPVLPIEAVRQDMFGDVTLLFEANEQGRVTNIKIARSSGFKALDKAAIIALSRCKIAASASGEATPARTVEYKFGRQVRVDSSSPPVLVPGSCAASERFTGYGAARNDMSDRAEADGISVRFGVTEGGAPMLVQSYEHDKVLAAEAIAYLQSCRFTPALINGKAAHGNSYGWIRRKAEPSS